jgi:preprotein translocase subunit SecE
MNKKNIAIPKFSQEVIEELKRVSWPTKKKTIRLTAIVIIISLTIGFYIGIIDLLLAKGLEIVTSMR